MSVMLLIKILGISFIILVMILMVLKHLKKGNLHISRWWVIWRPLAVINSSISGLMILLRILTIKRRRGGKETRRCNLLFLKSIKSWAITSKKERGSRRGLWWGWVTAIWQQIRRWEDWLTGCLTDIYMERQRLKKLMTMEWWSLSQHRITSNLSRS